MIVFYVYCITDVFNNKKYVGKFNRDVKLFKSYYGSGYLIRKAIKKRGRENFIKEILEECSNLEQLNDMEIYWICKLNTIENGYNLVKGGDGGDTSKYIDYSNSNYLKLKKNKTENYWKNLSKEERKKRSEKVSGDKNPMFGVQGFWKGKKIPKQPFNEKKQKFGKDNPNWKNGKTFCKCGNRISSNSKNCGSCIDRSGINNPFYGKSHSEKSKELIRKERIGKYNGNQEKTVLIDGKEYKSLSDASRQIGVVPATILFRIKSKHFKNYNYK